MKVVYRILSAVGFGVSLAVLFSEIYAISTYFLIGTLFITLILNVYSLIINILATAKYSKQKHSIAMGVMQCTTLVGIAPGVLMIVCACLAKKANKSDEFEEVIEEVVECVAE